MTSDREIKSIQCSCGGQPVEGIATPAEEENSGCGREGCCVRPYRCPKCGTRFVFAMTAPDERW